MFKNNCKWSDPIAKLQSHLSQTASRMECNFKYPLYEFVIPFYCREFGIRQLAASLRIIFIREVTIVNCIQRCPFLCRLGRLMCRGLAWFYSVPAVKSWDAGNQATAICFHIFPPRSCVVLFSTCSKILGCWKLGHRHLLPHISSSLFSILPFNLSSYSRLD
jgi:hypothetical protein